MIFVCVCFLCLSVSRSAFTSSFFRAFTCCIFLKFLCFNVCCLFWFFMMVWNGFMINVFLFIVFFVLFVVCVCVFCCECFCVCFDGILCVLYGFWCVDVLFGCIVVCEWWCEVCCYVCLFIVLWVMLMRCGVEFGVMLELC